MTRGEAGALITVGTGRVRHPARQAQGGRRPDRGRRRFPIRVHPGDEARTALAGGRPARRPDGGLRHRASGTATTLVHASRNSWRAIARTSALPRDRLEPCGKPRQSRFRHRSVSTCRNAQVCAILTSTSRPHRPSSHSNLQRHVCVMSRRSWIIFGIAGARSGRRG